MAAYRCVYDSHHLQADCQNRDQLRNPTLGNQVWATFFTPPEEERAKAIANMHKKLVKIGRVVPKILSETDKHTHTSIHTDRQTDTLITILRSPIEGRVIISERTGCFAKLSHIYHEIKLMSNRRFF